MNVVWNFVVFLFFINISAGIFTNVLGLDASNINYNQKMSDDSNIFDMNTATNESPVSVPNVEENSFFDWTSAFINIITLGFLVKLANFLTTYLFGVTTLLQNLIPVMPVKLVYYINTVISFLYVYAIISLITSRRIDNK